MKTEFTLYSRSNKDNIATATVLAISLFAFSSGVFTSNPATAGHPAPAAVQKLDTIVVTAPRIARVSLDTMIVTAPRNISHA